MRILVDGSLPQSLSGRPNPEGVLIDRLSEAMDDAGLVVYASDHGYGAVVVSEPEVLAQQRVRTLASERSVALVYSVADDPQEAETNLRHGLRSLVERISAEPGGLFRIGRSGVHPSEAIVDADVALLPERMAPEERERD